MKHVPSYLIITLLLGAADAYPHELGAGGPRNRCQRALFAGTARPKHLPNPFLVDPEDEFAILHFIDALKPFGPIAAPYALNDGLTALFEIYRPDMSFADLSVRLAVLRRSPYSLKLLSRPGPANRSHRGRLRHVWFLFLDDVARRFDPRPTARMRHVARALMVYVYPSHVAEFLKVETRSAPRSNAQGIARSLAKLYKRYLPDHTPPDPGLSRKNRDARILAMWREYVDALDERTSDPRPDWRAPQPPPPHPVIEKLLTIEPDAPTVARALVARYPDISVKRPDAMTAYFRALHAEFKLPPPAAPLLCSDARNVIYKGTESCAQRVLRAWADFRAYFPKPDVRRRTGARSNRNYL